MFWVYCSLPLLFSTIREQEQTRFARCFYQVLLLWFQRERVLRDRIRFKDRLFREQGLQDRQEERPGGSPVGERLCRRGGFLLRHLWQPQRRGGGELGMKRKISALSLRLKIFLTIFNLSDRRAPFVRAALSCATKTGSLLARQPPMQVISWQYYLDFSNKFGFFNNSPQPPMQVRREKRITLVVQVSGQIPQQRLQADQGESLSVFPCLFPFLCCCIAGRIEHVLYGCFNIHSE